MMMGTWSDPRAGLVDQLVFMKSEALARVMSGKLVHSGVILVG